MRFLNAMLVGFLRLPFEVGLSIIVLCSALCLIFYLRYLLDLAEAARVQAVQAEQQRQLACELQMEAQRAEERMSHAYEQQRQLNQLKDQFIMSVNHELRTPLTAVEGWLALLSTAREQSDTDAQTIYLRRAMESCEVLVQLVNNVLDAAEVSGEVKPPPLETCAVLQVVREELERLDPRVTQAFALQLPISEQLTVWAHQHYLRRVLRNLLSNAFKYAPRGTCVIISAALENTPAQGSAAAPQVVISVQDAGPGILPAEQPLLFEKFVRLRRDAAMPVRGSGLGLYISKQLVEAMGGHIWVESSGRAGEGSRFCFTLPAAADTSLPVRGL